MQLTWDEIRERALKFSGDFKNAKKEEAEAQSFETAFLNVFGVSALKVGAFEVKVPKSKHTDGYIDYLWKGKLAIEMKSRGKSLDDAYTQLRDYMAHLPPEEVPDLWMMCDFETIRLRRLSLNEEYTFKTKDLQKNKNLKLFADLAGYALETIIEQEDVNVKAAEKMAKLHDALKRYGYDGHDLEVYLVRLLFCLFAEDTNIFIGDAFLRYIENSKEDGSDLSARIGQLFEVLNTSDETRAKKSLWSEELKNFRYINGRLFEHRLPPADFDAKMRKTLLDCCYFDWSKISPAIFGAMFQGVMDKDARRDLGAHYTSEENILKLIKPLFLDALREAFKQQKTAPELKRFQDQLASLKFLDPACGCGNFLMITYRELRRLELEVLMKLREIATDPSRLKTDKKIIAFNQKNLFDVSTLLKVNVSQFYGIEIEDFPCQIAQVGMWLIDHQMNLEASEEFGVPVARLPLTSSATIVHGNALRLDWEGIVPKEELSYILGNPPFNGARTMNTEQKSDMESVFGTLKGAGNLDYVTAWYYKAAQLIKQSPVRAAFVSTNSITQGEQVALIWKPLIESFNLQIDFGYRTFKWSNEAKGKAAVHCVIVGFSDGNAPCVFVGDGLARPDKRDMDPVTSLRPHLTGNEKKTIFDGNNKIIAQNINGYLIDAPNVFIESRNKPLCDVPEMVFGNMPNDGGNLIINKDEYEPFLNIEPKAKPYLRKFVGADEFINNIPRYCLWLEGVAPSELRSMPEVKARIERVKILRNASPREATRKKAATPMLFGEIRQPDTDYIIVPSTSSERRDYVPIGFMSSEVIASNANLIIPSATLYHFGILTSNVHNAWMRAVCGRLKSDYRYSKDIVYNNFVWADKTDKQKEEIEKLAQAVLDARARFPNSSLADLYDPLTRPLELIKAHAALDRAVMKLYGYSPKTTEAQIVADLMKRYQAYAERTSQLFTEETKTKKRGRKVIKS